MANGRGHSVAVPEITHPAVSVAPGVEAIQLNGRDAVFALDNVTISYGGKAAVADVTLSIPKGLITAFIGPSGCGKSTLLRSLNRMNDLVPGASVTGPVHYHGVDLYSAGIDPVEVRRRIGMVFQRPNPFPKSIFDNVAYGPRALGMKGNMSERVEAALQKAALWDEVKDKLKRSALGLSGGQQQRLCIARALAVAARRAAARRAVLGARPDLDGSHRGADDRAAQRLHPRRRDAQHAAGGARRRRDGVLLARASSSGLRAGVLVEFGPTTTLFSNPTDSRTADYVQGRFG